MPIESKAQMRLIFRAKAGKSSQMSPEVARKFLKHGKLRANLPERKRRKTIATSRSSN